MQNIYFAKKNQIEELNVISRQVILNGQLSLKILIENVIFCTATMLLLHRNGGAKSEPWRFKYTISFLV
jgi:hypothetical protein